MDVIELIPGPINAIPNEIVEEILRYVHTKELLRSCRLVSRTWSNISTKRCHDDRRVSLRQTAKLDWHTNIPLFEIFERDTEPPWSKVVFSFDGNPDYQTFCDQVCDGFGASVRSIDASVYATDYDNFFGALRHTPNLQELKIRASSDPDFVKPFVFPENEDIQLRKLKHLAVQFDYSCQVVDLMEFILQKTGAPLISLEINTIKAGVIQETEFQRLIKLICELDIQNLAFHVIYRPDHFGGWKTLAQHPVKIQELTIDSQLQDTEIQSGEVFSILERFLANCVGLQTLNLVGFDMRAQEEPILKSKLLKFPKLPDLKNLHIEVNSGDLENIPYNPDPEFPLFSFNLVKATDFPNLEMVYLEVQDSSIDIRKMFDTSGAKNFDTVKFLHIQGRGVQINGKLSSIFPNVTNIKASIEDYGQLFFIIDDMKHLIEMDLGLWSYSYSRINVLLLDIVAVVQVLLKKPLEKLTVRNFLYGYREAQGLDSTGLLSLESLKPLILSIYDTNVKETDDIVTELRNIHRLVHLFEGTYPYYS